MAGAEGCRLDWKIGNYPDLVSGYRNLQLEQEIKPQICFQFCCCEHGRQKIVIVSEEDWKVLLF